MAKSKKKEGVKAPSINPASEALKKSNEAAKIEREEKEVVAQIETEEKMKGIIKSFDPVKVIKDAAIPESTKEVWITEDAQVFFRENFARKHGANKKLKVHHVKI